MALPVVITEDAEHDLEDIVAYMAKYDSRRGAEHVLARILEIAENLSTEPARGSQPKELRSLGDREYRQVFFKPYRLIYRVVGQQVVVYLIVDGRREKASPLCRWRKYRQEYRQKILLGRDRWR